MEKELICEVCNKNKAIGVASVPGVPFSAAYCQECLRANAHPWGIVVANTVCCGGIEYTSQWWKDLVDDTCKHLGKSKEEFETEVNDSLREDYGTHRTETKH